MYLNRTRQVPVAWHGIAMLPLHGRPSKLRHGVGPLSQQGLRPSAHSGADTVQLLHNSLRVTKDPVITDAAWKLNACYRSNRHRHRCRAARPSFSALFATPPCSVGAFGRVLNQTNVTDVCACTAGLPALSHLVSGANVLSSVGRVLHIKDVYPWIPAHGGLLLRPRKMRGWLFEELCYGRRHVARLLDRQWLVVLQAVHGRHATRVRSD